MTDQVDLLAQQDQQDRRVSSANVNVCVGLSSLLERIAMTIFL